MVRGLGDAAAADLGPVTSGQHHIDQLDLAQLLEHPPRFMAQAGSLATLAQRLPKNVGQEADQDVGQDALFFLMPDRTQPRSLLWMRNAASASVNWMYAFQSSSSFQSVTLLRSR